MHYIFFWNVVYWEVSALMAFVVGRERERWPRHFNGGIETASAAVVRHSEEKNFCQISAVWGASGNI